MSKIGWVLLLVALIALIYGVQLFIVWLTVELVPVIGYYWTAVITFFVAVGINKIFK